MKKTLIAFAGVNSLSAAAMAGAATRAKFDSEGKATGTFINAGHSDHAGGMIDKAEAQQGGGGGSGGGISAAGQQAEIADVTTDKLAATTIAHTEAQQVGPVRQVGE